MNMAYTSDVRTQYQGTMPGVSVVRRDKSNMAYMSDVRTQDQGTMPGVGVVRRDKSA